MAETIKKWLLGLLRAVGTFALFAPATDFDFVTFDDPLYVSANPHLAGGLTPASVRWAFTTSYASNWHPLTWISHLSDVTLFGLDPAGHHLTSILQHAGSVALLFFILRGLTGALLPSLFAAALFAVHPLRVESVVWISERKDALSMFFGLLTLGMYTIQVRRRGRVAGAMVVLCYAARGNTNCSWASIPGLPRAYARRSRSLPANDGGCTGTRADSSET